MKCYHKEYVNFKDDFELIRIFLGLINILTGVTKKHKIYIK